MTINPTTITHEPGTPFIDVVREFDAPPARVFRAHTDPELVKQWLRPGEIEMRVLEFDARPGGRYRYLHRDADGGEYAFSGVFHQVDQDRRIVQTFEFDGMPGQVSLDAVTFEDIGGRTRLTTHSTFPSVAARDAMIASGMEPGLRDAMDHLAGLLAPGQVVIDITMSLDGYVAAAGVDLAHGLGIDGDVIHDWVLGARTQEDTEVLDKGVARTGAVVMGRTLFDIIDGPDGWNDEVNYGADRAAAELPPVFVVTHSVPDQMRLGERFTFVTDGLRSTLAKAKAAAGDKHVVIMGGGQTCHAFLNAGLVDIVTIHLAPIVLGAGTRLFPAEGSTRVKLELVESVSTPGAEHLTYRVLG
jgi:uncharacterized protein YndB with AHSA1/START domain/dihydrofolate reductase